jgi:hypothetical protein
MSSPNNNSSSPNNNSSTPNSPNTSNNDASNNNASNDISNTNIPDLSSNTPKTTIDISLNTTTTTDISLNTITTTTTTTTTTTNITDISATTITNNDDFSNLTLDQTTIEPGLIITNKQGTTVNGNEKTESTFNTTDDINNTVSITQNLVETVSDGYDNSSETGQLVAQIRTYADKIKCEDFHGKGNIDDYNSLFEAAAKIANDSKKMQLDINIDGFEEFGKAADDLSALFTSFTKRLQSVNIIDDSNFLKAVLAALIKISNLSDVFGRFKNTILMTSTVNIPKSANDTKVILESVMGEVSCAMGYINNFVTRDSSLPAAELSAVDKNIITKAVATIDNWNVLCEQGVSIALSSNPDIQYIKQANLNLKQKSGVLKTATDALRAKFSIL